MIEKGVILIYNFILRPLKSIFHYKKILLKNQAKKKSQ